MQSKDKCMGIEQARSQKILLGSAFKEQVDLLTQYLSPEAVEELIIVWCMFIAYIHESLYLYFFKSAFYLCALAKSTLLFMQIALYCMNYTSL